MLALFVSPCKMPEPKLRGEVLSQGGLLKGENVCFTTLLLYTINAMDSCKVFAKIKAR